MTDVVVLIPVLGRPERVEPTLWTLENGRGDVEYRGLFLVNRDDAAELRAVRAAEADCLVVPWAAGRGDFAMKTNYGLRHTEEPWLFLAADDLCYCPGWLDRALEHAALTGRRVIGTNDLGNSRVMSGAHSTHTLVARSYADELGTIDEPGLLLHEGYWHNFVDDEMVETAKARAEFSFARDSWVEHLHPHWGKARMDRTYRRGLARFDEDRALLEQRRALWAGLRSG